jgi:hypothetical protein
MVDRGAVERRKTGAPACLAPTVRRSSTTAMFAKNSLRQTAFLPGSAQNVEYDVTSRKQTVGKFLPGATTGPRGLRHGRSLLQKKGDPISLLLSRRFTRARCRISNRNWPKNRSHRKQTSRPRLTGTRIDIRHIEFLAHSFAQRSDFYKWSRPLLIDSDTPIEFDVTRTKQTTEKFLTDARTHISDFTFSPNSLAAAGRRSEAQDKAGASSRTPKERKPVRRDRSCPIERIAREARGCGRWNRVGSIRTAHRSLGHADQ